MSSGDYSTHEVALKSDLAGKSDVGHNHDDLYPRDSEVADLIAGNFTEGAHAARLAATPTLGRIWKETDTGLVYKGTGAAWGILIDSGTVSKIADQSYDNSAVLADDNHLFWPIEPGEYWWFDTFLLLQGQSTSPDWTFGLAVSGAGTFVASWTAAQSGSIVALATTGSPLGVKTESTTVSLASQSGTHIVWLAGLVNSLSVAANLKLRASQVVATNETAKIKKGSHLRLRRLA